MSRSRSAVKKPFKPIKIGGRSNLHSAPQKLFAEEGELLTIDLSIPVPFHKSSATKKRGSIYILNASWHNIDVTENVASITAKDPQPDIIASNHEFFVEDSCHGQEKIISVTWSYSDIAAALSYCDVRAVTENSSIQIPPTWMLFVRTGTLHFDTKNGCAFASPDPLPGWQKTISILYPYGSLEPMQLLVTGDDSGYVMIDPGKRIRRNFFFSNTLVTSDIRMVAAVLGLQPVSEKRFSTAVTERKMVS
ncbi:hypothetical protein PEBR_11162 [Penicillium brasilianum]|uniref:Uncharacterized protein n=1 Tax=Penicillium brasilianum TaxID=104259 RepID=A0A1S9RT50_PENBI|nr:hypothetical protein PEBR_11162 [Penicillium brasilianum]